MLIYDNEYKEEDADFEVCMPIRKGESTDEITVRELAGGRCLSLLHKGPYDSVSPSYAKLFDYAQQKGYQIESPSRGE